MTKQKGVQTACTHNVDGREHAHSYTLTHWRVMGFRARFSTPAEASRTLQQVQQVLSRYSFSLARCSLMLEAMMCFGSTNSQEHTLTLPRPYRDLAWYTCPHTPYLCATYYIYYKTFFSLIALMPDCFLLFSRRVNVRTPPRWSLYLYPNHICGGTHVCTQGRARGAANARHPILYAHTYVYIHIYSDARMFTRRGIIMRADITRHKRICASLWCESTPVKFSIVHVRLMETLSRLDGYICALRDCRV